MFRFWPLSKNLPQGPQNIEVSGFTVRDGIGADLKLIPVLITGKIIFQRIFIEKGISVFCLF